MWENASRRERTTSCIRPGICAISSISSNLQEEDIFFPVQQTAQPSNGRRAPASGAGSAGIAASFRNASCRAHGYGFGSCFRNPFKEWSQTTRRPTRPFSRSFMTMAGQLLTLLDQALLLPVGALRFICVQIAANEGINRFRIIAPGRVQDIHVHFPMSELVSEIRSIACRNSSPSSEILQELTLAVVVIIARARSRDGRR